MKVLSVVPAVAPRYGGPSEAALCLARALRTRGAESLLLTTDADGPGRLQVKLGSPIEFAGARTLFFPRQWSEAFKFSSPLQRWLGAHVANYDLVHVDALFSHSSLAAACACRRRGVPYIVRPIGSLSTWAMSRKPLRKAVAWHLGVRRMIRGAAAVHYTSEIERAEAEAVLPVASGMVVPLGVADELLVRSDGAAFRRAFPEINEFPYVLALSRFHPVKGLDALVEAFLEPECSSRHPEWRLVLAGDGDRTYTTKLRDRVRRSRAEGRVLFTGWLEGELKKSALNGASMLALTSHHDSFGLCVLEALACGLPVLLSDHVGVAAEVRAAGAGWVTPLDQKALSGALREALGSAEKRAAYGAAGRRLVEAEYTWDAIAARLLQEYAAICRRSRL